MKKKNYSQKVIYLMEFMYPYSLEKDMDITGSYVDSLLQFLTFKSSNIQILISL